MEWCSCKHELNNKAFHPKDETSHPNNSQPTTTVTSRSPWPVAVGNPDTEAPGKKAEPNPTDGTGYENPFEGCCSWSDDKFSWN